MYNSRQRSAPSFCEEWQSRVARVREFEKPSGHKLHKLFESDKEIATKLKAGYVVVLIDVNEKHNSETNEKYGSPTKHGLPVIVVLDADGKQLTTKNTEELEEGDHHNPVKVKAFLGEWAAK